MEENIESNTHSNTKKSSKEDNKFKLNNNNSESKLTSSDPKEKIEGGSNKIANENKDAKNLNKIDNTLIKKTEVVKPKKEIPIEKKPFEEFINNHLIPSIIEELKQKGFEVKDIRLKNTLRPIAFDKCWVISCEIKDICNFWLSFEKEDISSSKSISISKPNQQPSIIESFLIDEKRITLKLIVSRILQRLNGQKLIGIN